MRPYSRTSKHISNHEDEVKWHENLRPKMNHSHNHNPDAPIVARYHKTNSDSCATPIWTGIFDPSFRVLILPRYLGVQTAIIPIPSSRRITSLEYEHEQQKRREQQQEEEQSKESESQNTLSSPSPIPSIDSFCSYSYSRSSESSHSVPRTSSSSSDSSYTSTSPTAENTHPQATHPSINISEEQSLYIPQLSPTRLASPDHFSEIPEMPTWTSIPKPSLDIFSDSDSDSDCDDDDYDDAIDDNDEFQPVIKDHEEEDSAICDLMEGFRKMSI